ncbi:MAG: response regulator [Myxococcaceae bacterium]|nr:response regulator [Myxococcaceae bacterium]
MSLFDQWDKEDAQAKVRHGHILVVDDEQDVREGLASLLSLEGFEVTTAQNGTVALERAKATRFDLALTDLRMPGLSGVETLMGLKRLQPDMPVIVVTGYASDEATARCMSEGAYDYITKPFDLDQLLRLIHAAVGGATPPPP